MGRALHLIRRRYPQKATPKSLIGFYNRSHDLAERYGIEMIAPHREQRRAPTQDARPLRRYRKRWRVERLFAWLHHFRRLVIRWEYHVENFFGMVRLGVHADLAQVFVRLHKQSENGTFL